MSGSAKRGSVIAEVRTTGICSACYFLCGFFTVFCLAVSNIQIIRCRPAIQIDGYEVLRHVGRLIPNCCCEGRGGGRGVAWHRTVRSERRAK
jgi:hypothetical protein